MCDVFWRKHCGAFREGNVEIPRKHPTEFLENNGKIPEEEGKKIPRKHPGQSLERDVEIPTRHWGCWHKVLPTLFLRGKNVRGWQQT